MSEPRIVLIGPGEVGRRLTAALERDGWRIDVVTRDRGWNLALDEQLTAPRLLAMREEDLGPALDRFPASLRSRLLLVQNGFLEAVHGDMGPVSRGLVWFMSKGDVFHSLTTSLFYGSLATGLVPALSRGGLDVAEVAVGPASTREMILKGIWNCLVGLPLAVHGVDLATYRADTEDELLAMIGEACAASGAEYGVSVAPEEALAKIDETIGPIGWVRGGKKALPWRNGAIARFGRRHGIATPVTDRLLARAGFDPESP